MEELPLDRPLDAIEDHDAWWVVVDHEPEDWLVRFEKNASFDASDWAFNMVRTFNSRLRASELYRQEGGTGSVVR